MAVYIPLMLKFISGKQETKQQQITVEKESLFVASEAPLQK